MPDFFFKSSTILYNMLKEKNLVRISEEETSLIYSADMPSAINDTFQTKIHEIYLRMFDVKTRIIFCHDVILRFEIFVSAYIATFA